MSVTKIDVEQRNRAQYHHDSANDPDVTGADNGFRLRLPDEVLQVKLDGTVHVYHQSHHRRKIEDDKKPAERGGDDCQSLSPEPAGFEDCVDRVDWHVNSCVKQVHRSKVDD